MTRRYRVLHAITTFPLSSGAAENTRLTLNLLNRKRFEPFLATVPGQSMDSEVAGDVVRIPLHWLRRSINPFVDLCALAELYRVIRRFGFDVVHTHNAKDGILGRWAASLAKVPAIVHTVHNVSFEASSSRMLNRCYVVQERWAARVTSRMVVVSRENSAKYLKHRIGQPDQYHTVYSGLDFSRYVDDGRPAHARRASLGLPDRRGPWVAWLGRLSRQKDPLTFIRAARLVANKVPGVQFVICGDDPLSEALEISVRSLVAALELTASVHFVGFQRNLANVLYAVDLVMQSSRYEGMGRTLCEALVCGRPVAATAVDGVREVILSGARGGLLAPAGNPEALAAAACRLLVDHELAGNLARSGQEWVLRHLSAERMVGAVESIYEEALTLRNLRPRSQRELGSRGG